MDRRVGLIPALLFVGAGCGSLTFGLLAEDGGEPVVDAGPADADPGDVPDVPDVPDAEPPPENCMDPEVPSYPDALRTAAWPFDRTLSAYQARFWDTANDPGSCTAPACHGDPSNARFFAPLIPAPLLLSANVETAIDELWERTRDAEPVGAPAMREGRIWAHLEGAPGAIPDALAVRVYSPAEAQLITDFVTAARDCHLNGWIEAFPGPVCTSTAGGDCFCDVIPDPPSVSGCAP